MLADQIALADVMKASLALVDVQMKKIVHALVLAEKIANAAARVRRVSFQLCWLGPVCVLVDFSPDIITIKPK